MNMFVKMARLAAIGSAITLWAFPSTTAQSAEEPCESECKELQAQVQLETTLPPLPILSLSGEAMPRNEGLVSLRPARNILEFDRFQSGAIASATDVSRWSLVTPQGAITEQHTVDFSLVGRAGSPSEQAVPVFVSADWSVRDRFPSILMIAIVFVMIGLIGAGFNRRFKIQRAIGLPDLESSDDDDHNNVDKLSSAHGSQKIDELASQTPKEVLNSQSVRLFEKPKNRHLECIAPKGHKISEGNHKILPQQSKPA